MPRPIFPLLLIALAALVVTLLSLPGAQAQGDITPPILVDLRLEPRKIDTTGADQAITVTAHFTDDLSGFGGAFIVFAPSIGTTQRHDVQFSGVTGGEIYTDTMMIPRYAAEGRWVIIDIAMVDRVGNRIQLFEHDADGVDEYRTYYFTNGGQVTSTHAINLPLIHR
jgi:hypothetical protein